MSVRPDTPMMKMIDEIKHYLVRLDNEELTTDLHAQLKKAFLSYRTMQNKMINTMLFDVDNFFEGLPADEISDNKVKKDKKKGKL